MNKVLAVAGFLILALSPSFVDWEQSPDLHKQIVWYYIIGVTFVYFGLDGWIKGG